MAKWREKESETAIPKGEMETAEDNILKVFSYFSFSFFAGILFGKMLGANSKQQQRCRMDEGT